jgi:hypothetical protein
MTKILPPLRTGKGQPPAPAQVVHNLDRAEAAAMKPLNFKVSPEFHREFKAYAAVHGVSMLDILKEGFALVKQRRG